METFRVETHDNKLEVRLAGDLTAETVPELQLSLRAHLAAGVSSITFDLADTIMLDSSGIGLLIASANSVARVGGQVNITHVSSDIYQLLQCMRLVDRLHVSAAEPEVCRG